MKLKLITLLLAVFTLFNTANAQPPYASTMKIGPFSIDMKNEEVDKICGKKIPLALLKESDKDYKKMVDVVVDFVNYSLRFYQEYDKDGKETNSYKVISIKTVSSNITTKSGIAIGMDKFDVLKKLDGMNISYRFYKNREYNDDGKITNNFYETIEIVDSEAYKTLTLEISSGKVSAFVLSNQEDGC